VYVGKWLIFDRKKEHCETRNIVFLMRYIKTVSGCITRDDDLNEQTYIQEDLEITDKPFNTITNEL
jgi:hypothetical protein